MSKFNVFVWQVVRGNILFRILDGTPAIDGVVGFSDLPRGIIGVISCLQNNDRWIFNFEVCCHNVKTFINAGNSAKIAPLLLVSDCLIAVPNDGDIWEPICHPFVRISISNMMLWGKVSGKSRAYDTNATTMGYPHNCCCWFLWLLIVTPILNAILHIISHAGCEKMTFDTKFFLPPNQKSKYVLRKSWHLRTSCRLELDTEVPVHKS